MSKDKKQPEIIRAETQFNIKIGEKSYTVNFVTKSFIRIQEMRPDLPTAFQVMEIIPVYQAIPLLIDCAIHPRDKDWSSHDEFLDLYEECEDTEAIAKVVPAYLSASGTVAKKLEPALLAIEGIQKGAGK